MPDVPKKPKMGRKRFRTTRYDEPRPEGDDWVEWGGELVWAAGFTSGGVPYDLTIVTRGVRRPFQLADGLDRVLAAYHEEGGTTLTKTDVHLHELCLLGGYYLAALQGDHPHPPEQVLQHMQGLLRRAEADVGRG